MKNSSDALGLPKRTIPDSVCDTRNYPGCGGRLYRWTMKTTLDYWPVIRCENHIKLQRLWQQYQEEWHATHEWWKWESPLPFDAWLLQIHWNEDISAVDDDFKYWELVTAANGEDRP